MSFITNPGKFGAEGAQDVEIQNPTSAFGDLVVAPLTPRVQLDAVYGLNSSDVEMFSATGGSTLATAGSMFQVRTGTSVGGFGVIRSIRSGRYRPGFGLIARFTAMFTTPVVNSLQVAGLFSAENALQIGYNGIEFAVLRRTGAALEVQVLTLTVAASGAETATVTIDGTGQAIPITAGTLAHNAAEIAAAYSNPLWVAEQRGDTVVFLAQRTGVNAGAFTYSSTGASEGTLAQAQAGADNVDQWVNQADWNIDPMDGSGPSGQTLDPTTLNVFEIRVQYLGAGAIEFRIEDAQSGRLVPVHRFNYPNANITPSLRNPNMKIGWVANSAGSTTDLAVSGASAAVFLAGEVRQVRNPLSAQNTKDAIGASFTNVLTIRNSRTFDSRLVNLVELIPVFVSIAVEGSRPAEVELILDATLAGETDFQPVREGDSPVDVDVSGGDVAGGEVLTTLSLSKNGQVLLDLNLLNVRITHNRTLTIAARAVANTTECAASVSWVEE